MPIHENKWRIIQRVANTYRERTVASATLRGAVKYCEGVYPGEVVHARRMWKRGEKFGHSI